MVNAKAAASVVSKKAATVYDASKHKISAETLKRGINKKFMELGKLTYKATTEDIDLSEEIAQIADEIRELKENLDVVIAHIASIRNQKICPECGNKVTKASLFCNICGTRFEDPVGEVEVEAEKVAETAAEDAAEDITVAVQEAEEVAAETVEAVEDKAEEAVEEVKEAVEEFKESAE